MVQDAKVVDVEDANCSLKHRLLYRAAVWGHLEAVKWLVNHGADVQTRSGEEGIMALHGSAVTNNVLVLQYLVREAKAPLEARAAHRHFTALHLAAPEGQEAAVKWLVEHGADMYAEDSDGRLPMDVGQTNGHEGVVAYLEQRERDVEEQHRVAHNQRRREKAKRARQRHRDAAEAAAVAALQLGEEQQQQEEEEEEEAQGQPMAAAAATAHEDEKEEETAGGAEEGEQSMANESVPAALPALANLSLGQDDEEAAAPPPPKPTAVPPPAEGAVNCGAAAGGELENEAQVVQEEDVPMDVDEWLLQGFPSMFIDPISLGLLEDPVVAMDYHTYSRASIQGHIDHCARKGAELLSPLTGLSMGATLMPNFSMRSGMADYVDGRLKEWEQLQQ